MADVTINDLPNVSTPLSGTEIFHGIQSSVDKKASATIIANFVMNDSNYSPLIVNITGNHTIVSTNIRKQYIIATISSNATITFPGSYGDGKEIVIKNKASSTANVIGLPDSDILFPGEEATYFWDGTQFVRRIFFATVASGFRGIIQDIINGSMTLWQRGTSFVSPSSGQYLADRFFYTNSGITGTVTVTRDLNTPNPNYAFSMKIACTATDTVGPTDNAGIIYRIEGNDLRKYFNQYGVWGIYARAVNKPGIYCVAMCNGAFTRCYVSEVNIGTGWAFIPIPSIFFNQTPISGGGSWDITTGTGLNIFFTLACGTTYQGTPYQWNTSLVLATSNQVNFFDSTSNELYLTAMVFNPGTEVQGFNGYNIEQDLARAQRYYEVMGGLNQTIFASKYNSSGGIGWGVPLTYNVCKRAVPTITVNGTWAVTNTGQPVIIGANVNGFSIVSTSVAAGESNFYTDSTDDTITIDAEL